MIGLRNFRQPFLVVLERTLPNNFTRQGSGRLSLSILSYSSGLQNNSVLKTKPWSKEILIERKQFVNTMPPIPVQDAFPFRTTTTKVVDDENYDTVLVIAHDIENVATTQGKFHRLLRLQAEADAAVNKEVSVFSLGNNRRFVYSPASVGNDYDDVRSYTDAAVKGVKRALSAGAKSLLLAVVPNSKYPNAKLVALLSVYETLYMPIQYREELPDKASKLQEFGIVSSGSNEFLKFSQALEWGRYVSRDLGGGDPERMAPPKFAEYVKQVFKNSAVKIEIIDKHSDMEKDYPLFAAVNRAANVVERHRGRIVYLTYTGAGPITKTLLLCGKGITYDTGGADIKAGGIMAGMSRDKCGAAAVAGFFKTLDALRPAGVKVIGVLAIARNSVGEECYVSDEILTTRAGVRIRVGNTDAEGRMVMTDPLCRLKELALNEVNPHLMTIATLTGHACLAVGNYTAVMDNGPAKAEEFAQTLQKLGEEWGDMFEVSTIRRDDYKFVKSPADGEDLLQCNSAASSRTPRGHQFPAAFMVLGAGLDKHGLDSKQPLKYSHLDIAGSSGHVPDVPTGVPILALTRYILDEDYLKSVVSDQ